MTSGRWEKRPLSLNFLQNLEERICLQRCSISIDENAVLWNESASVLREICFQLLPEFLASSSDKLCWERLSLQFFALIFALSSDKLFLRATSAYSFCMNFLQYHQMKCVEFSFERDFCFTFAWIILQYHQLKCVGKSF